MSFYQANSTKILTTLSKVIEVREERLQQHPSNPKTKDYGIKNENFKVLANEATHQWTGNFNPKPTDLDDFISLYECAL